MVRDREAEARLSDGRTCGDDDEVAAGEAFGVRIDLAEARGDATHLEGVLHPLGDVVVVLHQRGLDVTELGVDRLVPEAEDPLLRAVQCQRDVRRLVVGVRSDVLGGVQESPQQRAISNDLRVTLHVDRRRRRLDELAQVGRPADLVEHLVPGELDLHGERIDPLAPLEQRLRGAVDPLVLRLVEVLGPEQVRHLEDGVAVDEQRPEDALLGGEVVRRGALGRLLRADRGHLDS